MRDDTWVPAGTRRQEITPAHVERIGQGSPVIMVDEAFAAQASTTETATPIGRSLGFLLRWGGLSAVWVPVALGISIAAGAGEWVGFIVFGAMSGTTFYMLDRAERWDSATGVEHHRIEAAVRLASEKIQADKETKGRIIQGYLNYLEGTERDTQTTKQIR